MVRRAHAAYGGRVSIRLRCPNVGLTRPVSATVVASSVDALREGDHVEFHTDAGRTDLGELRAHGQTYRVGNVQFLGELSDERFTFVECEFAD